MAAVCVEGKEGNGATGALIGFDAGAGFRGSGALVTDGWLIAGLICGAIPTCDFAGDAVVTGGFVGSRTGDALFTGATGGGVIGADRIVIGVGVKAGVGVCGAGRASGVGAGLIGAAVLTGVGADWAAGTTGITFSE